jgi:nucleoside-diphosphate-sugar epimerase
MSRNILIFGATGQQGGATVKALLDSPRASEFTILAVTRNATSPAATKLGKQGVKIVQGDLDDVPAIFEAAEKHGKVWGVFAVQVSISCQTWRDCKLKFTIGTSDKQEESNSDRREPRQSCGRCRSRS